MSSDVKLHEGTLSFVGQVSKYHHSTINGPLHMYGDVLDFYKKTRIDGRHKYREKLKFDEGS